MGSGETGRRYGAQLPVCLIGHSLGGRAALLAAGEPAVRGVVALAPWVYPTELPTHVRDTPVVIIHGSDDAIASPERSEEVAANLRRQTQVTYTCVRVSVVPAAMPPIWIGTALTAFAVSDATIRQKPTPTSSRGTNTLA